MLVAVKHLELFGGKRELSPYWWNSVLSLFPLNAFLAFCYLVATVSRNKLSKQLLEREVA